MGHLSAVTALPAIPSQIGRYKIVCELGQGGMGTIYLGRAEGIGGFERLMAIKMIHPHLSKQQSFINMFLDEARIAALIRHPNVVPVYEIGEHFGRHFIAMDYVSGEPLSILLDNTWCRGIPLDLDIVAYVISVVCEALHAAHDLNDPTGRPLKVVHRDVCPQNIMLGYDGVTRVMDFGVAKAVDQLSQTRPGTHKGKVPYMAPEQIRCQPIDRRSDIFSLGVVLWESTIGKRLFKAENDILSASKVLKGKVPRPSRARESYPLELEAIVLRALNPRPEKRFQTAREMGQALREYLGHRASLVAPSDLESLLKTICRNRYDRRMEMERRAATAPLDAGPIEEDTIQLFASGESNLPSFDIEAALPSPEDPTQGLMSMSRSRRVYEYEDEEVDDATVRTQLKEIGFVNTDEFNLLEEDRDAPSTIVRPTSDLEPPTRKTDTSAVRELVRESDAALARSSQELIKQLVEDELGSDVETQVPSDLTEHYPVMIEQSYDDIGPEPRRASRGLVIITASVVAVALVAFGLASALEQTPAEETKAVETKQVAESKAPELARPKMSSAVPLETADQAATPHPPPEIELPPIEPKIAPPPPKEPPKAKEAPKSRVAEATKEVREAEPVHVEEPARAVEEEEETADTDEVSDGDPELEDGDKPKLAKRSKGRKKHRDRVRVEKKKTGSRILLQPDEL